MKKRYLLIGILLLLVVGAGTLIYQNNKNSDNETIEPLATAPLIQAPEIVPVDNAPTDNVSEPETGNPLTKTRRHRHTATITLTEPAVQSATTGEQVFASNTQSVIGAQPDNIPEPVVTEPLAVVYEAPKVFYGNVSKKRNVRFGPEGGVNMSGLYRNNTPNLYRNVFHIGAIADVPLSSHLSLQPGLKYKMNGNKIQSSFADTTETLTLHYIQLPASIVYKFGDEDNCRFIVGVGPYLSYLLNAKDKLEIAVTNDENTPNSVNDGLGVGQQSLSVTDGDPVTQYDVNSIRTLDWGVGGFIGCETPGGFFAKAGAEVGLRNINAATNDRNYNFMLSIGYLLGSK